VLGKLEIGKRGENHKKTVKKVIVNLMREMKKWKMKVRKDKI